MDHAEERTSGSELLALAAGWDAKSLAVLGHRSPGDLETLPVHFIDDLLIGKRILLILFGDDLEQFLLDGIPGDLFAVRRHRSATEEALEWKDSPRRLNPFVVHGAAHGRDVHPNAVGDLLHLERFDEFGTLVKKHLLVINDRPSDLEQRVAALLDRFNQPAG